MMIISVYFPVVAGGAALIFTTGLVPVAPMALGLLGIGRTVDHLSQSDNNEYF